ncbi:MAG TPA: hypothetical protein VLJ42_09325 [Solirubrobacteraceae bacterium]|nr:hypothetical protein [Solirubrobacteraceae bacterium]
MNQEMTMVSRIKRSVLLLTLAVAVCVLIGTAGAGAANAAFGIAAFDGFVSNQDGTAATQASSHPYSASTSFDFTTISTGGSEVVSGSVKTIEVALPAGFVGDPSAAAKCTAAQLSHLACPFSSQVGVVDPRFLQGSFHSHFPLGVYNMVPPPGVPGQFAFVLLGQLVHLNASIRTGGDYGLDIALHDVSQGLALTGTTLTFWGVPGDPAHDVQRCRYPQGSGTGECPGAVGDPSYGPNSAGTTPRPFLTLPSSCQGPQTTTLTADSWQQRGDFKVASFLSHDEHGVSIGATNCYRVPFSPSISVQPTTSVAGAPTGLAVDLKVPQNINPTGLAQANLKKTVVTLPLGVKINAASASGLGGCSPAQIDLAGAGAATCPDVSKIGSVQIDTPLVDHTLEGGVYLAQQTENPFGSLLAMYIAVADPVTGVVVKLPGLIETDPLTGQVKATIDNSPQLPFSEFRLVFKSGARAALANPPTCGAYVTHSELTSWASAVPVASDSPFVVDQGCDQAGRFEPSFMAGTVSPVAGGKSPFVLDFGRPDGQQTLRSLDVSLPGGLLGLVASVPLCAEAQAAAGSCSSASQVGSAQVAAGAGSGPVWLPQAGRAPTAVYLAGPYNGAPFSLSIVVPAQAGPFDLGTVVVRAALFVDPNDAHVLVKSDPLPSMLQGIPLQVQDVHVLLDRPGFMLNPTSCAVKQIAGTLTSYEGASANVGARFQVGDCARLPFSPTLSASTRANATRANGAGLDVKIVEGVDGEANVHSVRVDLPKQLPSRLTTLQQACRDSVFNANPAACPAGSVVGTGSAVTPVLNVPLSGPAYFVSHGGAAFPDLEVVLQGQGVTIVLDGSTYISKTGVTSSTFANVPDAPIVSFDLNLPVGPHSALTSNGSLCAKALVMPTKIVAQNGAQINKQTKIKVVGCPKAKKAKHKAKQHKAKQRKAKQSNAKHGRYKQGKHKAKGKNAKRAGS